MSVRRGYKFDSGGLRTADTNDAVPTMMEEDVFRVLKLPWIRESLTLVAKREE